MLHIWHWPLPRPKNSAFNGLLLYTPVQGNSKLWRSMPQEFIGFSAVPEPGSLDAHGDGVDRPSRNDSAQTRQGLKNFAQNRRISFYPLQLSLDTASC